MEAWHRYKDKKREAGLCVHCGKEPIMSEWYCWMCLNQKQYGVLEREAQTWQGSQTTPSEMHNTLRALQ
jgi:hypothetical protein